MVKIEKSGFTLLELLVVVAIIGILASIAYPNYLKYIINSSRTDMMSEMQSIATRIESRKLVEGVYSNIALTDVLKVDNVSSGEISYPTDKPKYKISIWDISVLGTPKQMKSDKMSSSKWEIRAIPVSDSLVADDGTLTLNYNGEKCRIIDGKEQCGNQEEWRVEK